MERTANPQNKVIRSLGKGDWNNILQRIMVSYNDISKSINPKGLLKINLTAAQIKLLTCFGEKEDLTMSELSQNLGVSMPTMTVMVDRLVNSKMVKRDWDSIDRRVVRVRLTDLGRGVLRKLVMIRRKEMEKILVHLNEEEMRNFLSSIEIVALLLTRARKQREREGGH
jgi:DNA-binding MarR family transcriptional regulator